MYLSVSLNQKILQTFFSEEIYAENNLSYFN